MPKRIRWKWRRSKYALNYIKLDGIDRLHGERRRAGDGDDGHHPVRGRQPANFLDVGGGANQEQIEHAFEILLSDENVKAIFINIFGGILRVDTAGDTAWWRRRSNLNVKVPIVLRLEGTNVEEGRKILEGVRIELPGRRNDEGRGGAGRGRGEGGQIMAVLVDNNTRLIVQGITGKEGTFHAKGCAEYGTKVVGGVTPGKGGTTHEGWPVFNTVAEAVQEDGRERDDDFCAAAVCCRRDSRSGRRGHSADRLHHRRHSDARHGEGVGEAEDFEVAPDRAELPGRDLAGQSEDRHHAGPHSQGRQRRHRLALGNADLRSRAPAHDSAASASRRPSASAAIRSSAPRTSMRCKLLNEDPETEAIIMIGEIGGTAEEAAAEYIKQHVKKPVVGFIAGQTAPPGRRMGHAGAIISGGQGNCGRQDEGDDRCGDSRCRVAGGDWRDAGEGDWKVKVSF